MSTIPSLKPREVVAILKRHGFIELRQAGSHLHLYHPIRKLRATVPMHNKDLKRKTLLSILHQANIRKEDIGR
jgi:predicted RNA binding protein YcfA (HicA-like mRNA interferase family)